MVLQINTPQVVAHTVSGGFSDPSIEVRAMHDPAKGRYRVMSLQVEGPVVDVTATLVRKLRLGEVRRAAIRAGLAEANPELMKILPVKSYLLGKEGRPVSAKDKTEPGRQRLEQAATVFHLALLAGDYPVRALRLSFGLSADEATRWRARLKKERLA